MCLEIFNARHYAIKPIELIDFIELKDISNRAANFYGKRKSGFPLHFQSVAEQLRGGKRFADVHRIAVKHTVLSKRRLEEEHLEFYVGQSSGTTRKTCNVILSGPPRSLASFTSAWQHSFGA